MDGCHTEMTPEFRRNLSRGLDYQDWVKVKFPRVYKNRVITFYEGKENQLKGESLEGIEVKYDSLIYTYCTTGRLYIETEEKANENNPEYVLSGIYRQDNTKYYLIGDYSIWFLFTKQRLVWLEKNDPPFVFRPQPTPTSKGYCLPILNAKLLCIDYQEFKQAS